MLGISLGYQWFEKKHETLRSFVYRSEDKIKVRIHNTGMEPVRVSVKASVPEEFERFVSVERNPAQDILIMPKSYEEVVIPIQRKPKFGELVSESIPIEVEVIDEKRNILYGKLEVPK